LVRDLFCVSSVAPNALDIGECHNRQTLRCIQVLNRRFQRIWVVGIPIGCDQNHIVLLTGLPKESVRNIDCQAQIIESQDLKVEKIP